MDCLRCDGTALEERVREGVVIDVCPRCRGVWLDRGELEKLLARLGDDGDDDDEDEDEGGPGGRGRRRGRRRDDDDDDDRDGGGWLGQFGRFFD